MNESLITEFKLNTSVSHQTSSSTDDSYQMTYTSAYDDVNRILWQVVPPALLVLGCYGNVMTIVVMRAIHASDSAGSLSVYFTALAVSDLFVLWTSVLWHWPGMVLDFPLGYFHDLSCTVPFFVTDVSSMTSAWFLVAMTCQRMTSVVLPHRVEALCTVRKGKIITGAIGIISCVTNLYILLCYHVEDVEEGYPSCMSKNKNVTNIFGFLYLCVASVIPFFVLIVANSVLIVTAFQSLKTSGKMAAHGDSRSSARSARVSSMTTTLMLTSAAFLLLTLPSCALLIYFELIGYYEGEMDDDVLTGQLALADTVCMLLWMANSSINFYIYILSGRKFRQEAKRCFCTCFQQKREASA